MNVIVHSGDPAPFDVTGERRVGYETGMQVRLFIDRFQLVQAPALARHLEALWALPGGGRASTAQLLALARCRGWKRPRVVEVAVRYRLEPVVAVSAETRHASPLAPTPTPAMLSGQGRPR